MAHPLRMHTLGGREQIATNLSHFGWSRWERSVTRALEAALVTTGPETSFLDVGANSGVYALLAKAVHPGREVHAFEPFPPARRLLERNVALNQYARDLVVSSFALADRADELSFYIPDDSHDLLETSASLRADFRGSHSAVLSVRAETLDSYLGDSLRRVGVIKVDVEGAEADVIRGARKTLERDRPLIIFEALPDTSTWEGVRQELGPLNYKVFALGDGKWRETDALISGVTNYMALPDDRPIGSLLSALPR